MSQAGPLSLKTSTKKIKQEKNSFTGKDTGQTLSHLLCYGTNNAQHLSDYILDTVTTKPEHLHIHIILAVLR